MLLVQLICSEQTKLVEKGATLAGIVKEPSDSCSPFVENEYVYYVSLEVFL